MINNNFFKNQPEFLIVTGIEMDDFGFTEDTIYTRYSSFIQPEKVKGLSFLDIGCWFGAAGSYVLANGAKEYVGVDFDLEIVKEARNNLEKYYKNHSWEIIHSSLNDYLKNNDRKFDVIFLSRTLHGMSTDSIEMLSSLSAICDCIVIESAGPFKSWMKIKELLIDNKLIVNENLNEFLHFLEYEYPYFEFMKNTNNNFYNVKHSLGFLKSLFHQLGFVEDFSSYENLKLLYPHVYGFGDIEKLDLSTAETVVGRYIVRFNKKYDRSPLSWEDFKKTRNV